MGWSTAEWIKPRPFQDDPRLIGKVSAAQNRESELEEVVCHLAKLGHQLDHSQEAVLATDGLWFGKCKVVYQLRMPEISLLGSSII